VKLANLVTCGGTNGIMPVFYFEKGQGMLSLSSRLTHNERTRISRGTDHKLDFILISHLNIVLRTKKVCDGS
jgi:hypothetical protein